MYQNKNQASTEHQYFNGKPSNTRDPPTTGEYRPPKSHNKDSYDKSKKVFEKKNSQQSFSGFTYVSLKLLLL